MSLHSLETGLVLTPLNRVHWWPGDRTSTKNWTQWDQEKFNSGVAGPFLKYAGENSALYCYWMRPVGLTRLSSLDQLLKEAGKEGPSSAVQEPQVSPPLTLPNPVPIVTDSSPSNDTPLTCLQPGATTTSHQAKYRPLSTKTKLLTTVEGTKKRKYTSKESRPIHYFEDSESDDSEAGDCSGDGSSSGDSMVSAPARAKCQRTSQIITRSSAQTLVPSTRAGGGLRFGFTGPHRYGIVARDLRHRHWYPQFHPDDQCPCHRHTYWFP